MAIWIELHRHAWRSSPSEHDFPEFAPCPLPLQPGRRQSEPNLLLDTNHGSATHTVEAEPRGLSVTQPQAKVTIQVVPTMSNGLNACRKCWETVDPTSSKTRKDSPPAPRRGRTPERSRRGPAATSGAKPGSVVCAPLGKQVGQLCFTQLAQTTATGAKGLGEICVFEDQPRQFFQSATLPGPG